VEKVMTFSRGLFQEAFHALSVNRAIAFTFLAAQVALQIFEEKLGHGGSGVQFFLFCILAICIHQAVIKPDFSVPNFTQRSMMWGYGWRLLVMLLLCGAMGYFLASLVPLPPEAKFVFIALAVIMVAILYALVLSMWGHGIAGCCCQWRRRICWRHGAWKKDIWLFCAASSVLLRAPFDCGVRTNLFRH
jgi:hypothetical protein